MNRSCRSVLVVWLAGLALTAPVTAKELWERPWLEARSEHFRLLSGLDEGSTRALILNLENFRRFVLLVTNVGEAPDRVPTTVYLLPERRPDFGFINDVAGYLRPTMRSNLLVLVPNRRFLDEFVKHEYVHALVHSRDRLVYPGWIDEGFAELLMTFEIDGTEIAWGKSSDSRASWLNSTNYLGGAKVLPFETLLAPTAEGLSRRDDVAMFYAQSWLLMHYLNFGRPDADFGAQTTEYLRLTGARVPAAQAFEQAYGVKVADLRSLLAEYSAKRLGFYRGKLPGAYSSDAVRVSQASRAMVATELGWLLVARGSEPALAEPYFSAALAADPESSRALAGLGEVRKMAGDGAGAVRYYEQAIAAEPGNALNELEYGEYFADAGVAARKKGDAAAATAYFVEARRHYARSYKLDPDNPETLAVNGGSYLAEGIKPDKAVESLEMAHDLHPANTEIRLLLAQALVANGERDAARPHVRALLARWHSSPSEDLEALEREVGADAATGPTAGAPTKSP